MDKRLVVPGWQFRHRAGHAQRPFAREACGDFASSRKDRIEAAWSRCAGARGHVLDLADGDAAPGVIRAGSAVLIIGLNSRRNTANRQLGTNRPDAARARLLRCRYWECLFVPPNYGRAAEGEGGSIVFHSGIAGQRPHAGWASVASICACDGGDWTRAMAVELAPVASTCLARCGENATWAKYGEADRGGRSTNRCRTDASRHVGRNRVADATST